ncbi:hypothetical protein FRB94_007766 [Tulasnella sp. JGI-2019a]|nr:hypothetical protein FRB94_007766 [Tulasnella sp. JGI-2019a]
MIESDSIVTALFKLHSLDGGSAQKEFDVPRNALLPFIKPDIKGDVMDVVKSMLQRADKVSEKEAT